MSKQWKCAVVGAGTFGQSHVLLLPQLDIARQVAICDLLPERAKTVLEKNNIAPVPIYTDLAQMLANEDIEVIHLATPSGAHLEPAIAAMKAGKHVICEKPLEVQLDRADRMIETAGKCGVRLACVFQGRWKDENRAIKQAVDEGRFGKISWAGCFTPWYRPDKYYQDVSWRGTWKLDGGGATMNQGIHAIDLLQWIGGPIKSVSAYASSRIHPGIETEDTLSAALQFENGAFGSILCTTAMFPGMPTRIEIGGENGTAVSENGLKMFSFREQRAGDAELLDRLAPGKTVRAAAQSGPALSQDLHGRNIRAILLAWAENREAETAGIEARKAIAIVLAMYESVRKGGTAVKIA
jgi:UDP-N-acetyl-2-amino-2-deoxyglucuronate dehydrogenase